MTTLRFWFAFFNITFTLLTVALPALLFQSCSDSVIDDESIIKEQPSSGNNAREYYIAVKIFDTAEASSTRATFDSNYDDEESNNNNVFNKGLPAEKALASVPESGDMTDGPHFLLFFDESGNKLGNKFFLLGDSQSDDNFGKWDFTQGDESDNFYTAYSTIYMAFDGGLDMDGDGDYEYQDKIFENGKILVILNASDELSTAINSAGTYEAVRELIVKNSTTTDQSNNFLYRIDNGTTYFTMTSSMVVKNGEIIPANFQGDGNATRLTWYESPDKAQENPYTMYVERLQCKYTTVFKFKNDNNYQYFGTGNTVDKYEPKNHIVYTSGTDFTPTDTKLRYVTSYTRSESIENRSELTVSEGNWKVNFTGWNVNGLEKEENLFKKLTASATYFDNWNQSPFSAYRNFWAEDNHYSTPGEYPDQYRTPVDATDVKGHDEVTPALNYYKYTDLALRAPHQYSPENTLNTSVFGSDLKGAYDSQAYLRAGTHVIVAAQLLIDGYDGNAYKDSYTNTDFTSGLINNVNDKYRMNDIYWSKDAYLDYVVEYLGYWMMSSTNSELYGSIDGNFYVSEGSVYRLADHNDFETADANIVGGDGWVWVKPKGTTTLYIKTTLAENNGEDTYEILPLGTYDSSEASYTKLAFEHKEYMAAHFNEGRMYYAIPVKHNLRTSTEAAPIATGDFGAVRNHWYEFEITSIKSPGTSVDKPDQPIVPNNEPESIGLGVNISILDWHTVNIEDVDVTEQPRPGDKSEK